jgi:hypothetical protein
MSSGLAPKTAPTVFGESSDNNQEINRHTASSKGRAANKGFDFMNSLNENDEDLNENSLMMNDKVNYVDASLQINMAGDIIDTSNRMSKNKRNSNRNVNSPFIISDQGGGVLGGERNADVNM